MSQMFLFYEFFYGGALVFLGGAGARASPSLAPLVNVSLKWSEVSGGWHPTLGQTGLDVIHCVLQV